MRHLPAAIIVLAACCAPAQAQVTAALTSDRPSLRSEATVTGDVVRIGDLVDHAGIVAKVPIFRAPDLGATGSVSADDVIEAVRAHAIVGLDAGGITDVTVTRASRAIALNEVESPVTRALSAQYPLGPAKDIVLILDRELRTIYVEPSAKGDPRLDSISFDTHNNRFDATVEVPGRRAMRLTGRAVSTVEVLTVLRPIARGEILKQDDFAVERRARSEAGTEFVANIDQAVGFAARGTLQAGRPLRIADVMKPEMIQRNEAVTLVYQVPGITLTVRGKAAEGGAEGDVIGVLNEQSKRSVQGVVVGPGRVVVSTSGPKLAANLEPSRSESSKPATDSNAQ
ncbi:MAG TPA: flagellar basal body P-ring formation chaperone FlgA [Pseudolabrys sp.]|nr:flagellar basal body P-ring formation chaperone FlgA [Pseudolabrys sp.]